MQRGRRSQDQTRFQIHAAVEETRLTLRYLDSAALFQSADLGTDARERLASLLELHKVEAGFSFVEQGVIASDLWILVEGEARLTVRAPSLNGIRYAPSSSQTIGALVSGDVVGVSLLLSPNRSDVSGVTVSRSTLLKLSGLAFDQFQAEFPADALKLQSVFARLLIEELKKAQTRLRLFDELLKSVS